MPRHALAEEMEDLTHYQILGLDATATVSELKAA